MRSTQRCPKCGGHRFAVNTALRQPEEHTSNATNLFRAITIDRNHLKDSTRMSTGHVETWICLGCGYMELYAYGLKNLAALAEQNPDQLRIIDARLPEQGPYR